MNGYVVEVCSDAPMRTRAWFENESDAREYAQRFGSSARVTAADLPTFVVEMARYAPETDVEAARRELADLARSEAA